jgi:hypothetical protein
VTRRLLALAVGLAVPVLAADAASACSCAAPENGGIRSIRSADGVFIGRLLAVKIADPPEEGEPVSSADPADFVYRVGRVYNGGPGLRRGRRVRVRSARSEATCGLPSFRRELYGLYVDRRGGRWHGNLCGVVDPDDSVTRRAARRARANATQVRA